jgi:hypothetical protein
MGRKMPYQCQRKAIERYIRAFYKKARKLGQVHTSYDEDVNMDTWLDNIDPILHFSENITNLFRDGVVWDLNYEEEIEERASIYLDNFIESITTPFYRCTECGIETKTSKEMRDHWSDKHGVNEDDIPKEEPLDFEYIILSALIKKYLSIKPKSKTYFSITSKELYEELKEKTGYDAIAIQTPTKVLRELGLLNHKKGEQNREWRDKYGRRAYHIKVFDLKSIISVCKYDNLKVMII